MMGKINMQKFMQYTLILILLSIQSVYAVPISVSVDRNPVNLDESFQIIFVANKAPDDDPDFAPLDKDFEILGSSQSSNTSIINGEFSKTIQWKLNVMAKRAGSLIIPPVAFGKNKSQPLAILVNQGTPDRGGQGSDELFFKVEATPENPYVQSQVIYTLRLYQRVNITEARLNEPEMADAVIEKLGEDSNFNTQVNGVNYHVTERKYAIFPQKSGTFTIAPLILSAEVVSSASSRFNGFFNRQFTHTKRVTSDAITLNVQPVPQTFRGKHWLAAEALNLSQEWSGDITQMKVGEPLTRTITLLAKGATVGQLPELNTATNQDKLKTYPDQPVLKEDKRPEGLIAFREEKIAFIPGQGGQFTLPAIEVPWFNTQTGKLERAKIPETTLTALAPTGSISEPVITKAPELSPIHIDSKETPQLAVSNESNLWMWLTAFFAVAWLVTLLYLLGKRKKIDVPVPDKTELSIAESVKALKNACADNNAQAAKDALIVWGRLKYQVSSLGALETFCDARFRDEIQKLNQHLYGQADEAWQGKKLFQTFSENQAMEKISSVPSDPLEPLYKI